MTPNHHYYPDPSLKDQSDFALRLYFGVGDNLLELAVRRAYGDVRRTVYGIGDYPDAWRNACAYLLGAIASLPGHKEIAS